MTDIVRPIRTTGKALRFTQSSPQSLSHVWRGSATDSLAFLKQLQEPLLLVGFFALFFSVIVAYNRCDFVITRDAAWESSQRAERAAFLIQKIESIVSGSLETFTSAADLPAFY